MLFPTHVLDLSVCTKEQCNSATPWSLLLSHLYSLLVCTQFNWFSLWLVSLSTGQLTRHPAPLWPRRPIRVQCPYSVPQVVVSMATPGPVVCALSATRSTWPDKTMEAWAPWVQWVGHFNAFLYDWLHKLLKGAVGMSLLPCRKKAKAQGRPQEL